MEDYPQNTHSEDIPKDLIIETRSPSPEPLGKESLEFHAARLLFLLKYAGGRKKKIVGIVSNWKT